MKRESDITDKELRELLTDFVYLLVAILGFITLMVSLPYLVCYIETII